jgi:hypothetical protein
VCGPCSELLSFTGDSGAFSSTKLDAVKGYVSRLQSTLAASRAEQLAAEQQKSAYQTAEAVAAAASHFVETLDGSGSAIRFSSKQKRATAPRYMAKTFDHMPPPPSSSPVMAFSAPSPQDLTSTTTTTSPVEHTSTTTTARTGSGSSSRSNSGGDRDLIQLPAELEQRFDGLLRSPSEGSIRPTILHTGDTWTKTSRNAVALTEPTVSVWAKPEQQKEKSRVFDLLDALTKSGEMRIEHAAMHVVLCATHSFHDTLVDTVTPRPPARPPLRRRVAVRVWAHAHSIACCASVVARLGR